MDFFSWLNGWKQHAVTNGKSASWANVMIGVPQSFVLGLLLFIIYIHDIDSDLCFKLCKFADYTKKDKKKYKM